jgi:hypothetical protein
MKRKLLFKEGAVYLALLFFLAFGTKMYSQDDGPSKSMEIYGHIMTDVIFR